jgi:hypothetical protein
MGPLGLLYAEHAGLACDGPTTLLPPERHGYVDTHTGDVARIALRFADATEAV